MGANTQAFGQIKEQLVEKNVSLVAVSKTKSDEDILALYQLGQRDFGENYVQELIGKYNALPKDINWHFIGHLQSNKVKLIAPFVHLIHSVDSPKLLAAIDKEATKNNRVINCLLQVHIAEEETKFGLNKDELAEILAQGSVPGKDYHHTNVVGLMGMASFTKDEVQLQKEFSFLKSLFDKYVNGGENKLSVLSMGMSSDYKIAMDEGSNMVRIGSLLFGERN